MSLHPADDKSDGARVPDHAAGFTRYPPGVEAPSIRWRHGAHNSEKAARNAERLAAGLDDYRDLFVRRAAQMFSPQFAVPAPPGHPLYSRGATLGALEDRNAELQKENSKLRERLERAERDLSGKGGPRRA